MGKGKKIVLAASDTESCEHMQSIWRQMLLATIPAKYAPLLLSKTEPNEVLPDGQASYVPHGLRVVEALLLQRFSPDEIAVCYTDQLGLFVGDDTRVVGVHAHNPLGITFATDLYSHFWGAEEPPLNAVEFRRLITHPALWEHKPHLKIIVGGPGSWQIEKKGIQSEWQIDCIVDGEAEDVVLPLFEAAMRGESLPAKVEGHSPKMTSIPTIRHRATYGVVEITRGCGRGCQFCSIALRRGKSYPLEQILQNVRAQVAEGAESVMLTTEDLFLYEQGPKFDTNLRALETLFREVCSVPGVKYLALSHGTMAPVVRNPEVIEALTPYAVGRGICTHAESTHPEKRYANFFIGLETGSPRLFEKYMKGKAYPYRSHQWPDVVLKGMEILNKNNWFPFCTFVLGLPGETRDDTKQSLDLLHALKGAKWCCVPTLFVPLDDTRLSNGTAATMRNLTDLQWEFFFTAWRYNLDFFRREQKKTQWKFRIGAPLYYGALGRRYFGPAIKYPLLRLGRFPERLLRHKLYLDMGAPPKLSAPQQVEIPVERQRPTIPLHDLAA